MVDSSNGELCEDTVVHDVTRFGLSEMVLVGADLRRLGERSSSLEDIAQRTTRYFVEHLRAGDADESACVLARFYKTEAYAALPAELREAARAAVPEVEPGPNTTCLTLLGTYGDRPEWRSRRSSAHHRAIPLASQQVLDGLPMVAELTRSLGLDGRSVIDRDSQLLLEKDREGFNVFHVRGARGSRFVPAQDAFVQPFGVESVIGFGFAMPPADIAAVILFTRVVIDDDTAQLFKTLALSLKLAVLPHAARPTFESPC